MPPSLICAQYGSRMKCGAVLSSSNFQLKLDRLVEGAALGTAGAIHVGIVGIDEATFSTTKDVVLAGDGAEAFLAALVIDSNERKRRQEKRHVTNEKFIDAHVKVGVRMPYWSPMAKS